MNHKPSFSIYIKALLFWLGLFFVGSISGQTEIGYSSDNYKTNYAKKLILRADLVNDVEKIEFLVAQDKVIKFSPNESLRLKINAYYDFLTLSYAYTPAFLPGNSDDDLKGETSTSNFGLNLFFNRIFGRAKVNATKGYYVENTDQAFPDYPEEYKIYENFETKLLSFEIGYNLNPNFSYKSYLVFNEVQTKSAGSFIPRIIYTASKYTLDELDINRNRTNKQFTITGNYIHTFVIKKNFSITLGLGIGIGSSEIEENNFKNPNPKKEYNNATGTGETIFQMTYQKDNLFLGLSSFSRGTTPIKKEIENAFKTQSLSASFFIGYRFNAPKVLEKTFTGVKNLIRKKEKKIQD